MKLSTHLKTLYRSPLRSVLTLLLLAAAAFLFLYNLSEYSVADREYLEARDQYEGVLTVEEAAVPEMGGGFDLFLFSDETGRNGSYGLQLSENYPVLVYENFHQQSLGEELIGTLAALPYVSRVERRYLTAGVSQDYTRLDTDYNYYPYDYRCVITATVRARYNHSVHDNWAYYSAIYPELEAVEWLELEDVELLAGDQNWLWDNIWNNPYEENVLYLQTMKEEYRERMGYTFRMEATSPSRNNVVTLENHVYQEDAAILQPGRRYLMVLRNNSVPVNILATEEYTESVVPAAK